MKVVVLGGTGGMGARVATRLEGDGHEVVRAARSTGVDVTEPGRLVEVLRGADCVVDCLNLTTTSRRRAVAFFGGAARAVSAGAAAAGVAHVVVVSIVNATAPEVSRSTGYYAGKAAQEAEYAAARVPVTVVRTTAWFTLAETFLAQLRVGRFALVPGVRLRPVHPDAVAELVTDVVEAGPTSGPAATDGVAVRSLAGPEELGSAAMARAVARRDGGRVRVVGPPVPVPGIRTGLLPAGDVPRDDRRFADWLRDSGR
ncbi:NAD(P)H-binding protein [Phycicoccus avicenniae]|uniref:NAD(P)H-binding protein n=1 Tax=Phycicoccus avicenniae TaxID=2828860 RepID=UPI003D2BC276